MRAVTRSGRPPSLNKWKQILFHAGNAGNAHCSMLFPTMYAISRAWRVKKDETTCPCAAAERTVLYPDGVYPGPVPGLSGEWSV